MGKLKEIWTIIRRRDFKDGEEVHAVEFNGGLLISNLLYEKLKPEIEAMPDTKYCDLYSVKILTTPYLPYIYRKVKRGAITYSRHRQHDNSNPNYTIRKV